MGADLAGLAAELRKPLRPLWVSQRSAIWLNEVAHPAYLPFTPLFLVSASLPNARQRRLASASPLNLRVASAAPYTSPLSDSPSGRLSIRAMHRIFWLDGVAMCYDTPAVEESTLKGRNKGC